MNDLNMPKPRILLPRLVYEKIMHFVNKENQECSGLGVTEIIGSDIVVMDVVMVKQTNSSGSTDMEAEAVSKAMFKFKDHRGTMNYWWHSHANMAVFWSGTDRETIAQIGAGGMCVASVFNRKAEVKSAIACMSPFPFFIDDVELAVESINIPKELRDSWDKEYDENVKSYKWAKNNYKDDWKDDKWEDNLWREGKVWDPQLAKYVTKEKREVVTKPKKRIALISKEKILERWAFVKETEEIYRYLPTFDEFEFTDGSIMPAQEYMDLLAKVNKEDENATESAHRPSA